MNHIHPSAVIGPEVTLGTGNVIGPGTVLLGPLVIGDDNWIGPYVAVGTPGEMHDGAHPRPWDQATAGGMVVIGSRNRIREYVTVQMSEGGRTSIGDDCYIMTKAHVPHDGQLGNRVTVSCTVMIGGHSHVGDGATIGLGTVIHQRSVIGTGAMVGMGSVVTRHIPPFAMAFGSPARVRGANKVGMGRAGYTADAVLAMEALLGSGAKLTAESVPAELVEAVRSWEADVVASNRG